MCIKGKKLELEIKKTKPRPFCWKKNMKIL